MNKVEDEFKSQDRQAVNEIQKSIRTYAWIGIYLFQRQLGRRESSPELDI